MTLTIKRTRDYICCDSTLYICLLPDQPERTQRGGDRQNRKRTLELPLQFVCQWRHLYLFLVVFSSDSILIIFSSVGAILVSEVTLRI